MSLSPGVIEGGKGRQMEILNENESGVMEQDPVTEGLVQEEAAPAEERGAETGATNDGEQGVEAAGAADRQPEDGEPEKIPDKVWAAARKRAEAEAERKAQARAEELAQKNIDEFYARQFGKYINPATGKPISNRADYEQAVAVARMKENGVDPQTLQKIVEESPAVKEANRVVQAARQREIESFTAQEVQALNKAQGLQLASVDEVAQQPNGQQIIELWRRGVPLARAYEVANFETVAEKKAAAARQAALNQVNGKRHLVGTGGAGGEGAAVTDEELARFRQFDENVKRDDILAFRKKHKEL